MDKTEWPTEKRIEELRLEGVIPYSSLVTKSLVVLAVVLSPAFLRSVWGDFLEQYNNLLLDGIDGELLQSLKDLLSVALPLLIVPAGIVIAACFVSVLSQTRGLFIPGRLGLDIGRLNPFRPPSFWKLLSHWPRALVIFIVQIACAVVMLYLCAPRVLGLLVREEDGAVHWLTEMYMSIAPVVLIVMFVTVFLALLFERYRFRYAHRMSRKEIEQEARG